MTTKDYSSTQEHSQSYDFARPPIFCKPGCPDGNLIVFEQEFGAAIYCPDCGTRFFYPSAAPQPLWMREMLESDPYKGLLDRFEVIRKEVLERLADTYDV